MVDEKENRGLLYFDESITDRERAIFEAAVSLGAVFHQFQGDPYSDPAPVEDAMREAALTQPYIVDAAVELKPSKGEPEDTYKYSVVTGKNTKIALIAEYGDASAEVEICWIEELDYPLMYVKKVKG